MQVLVREEDEPQVRFLRMHSEASFLLFDRSMSQESLPALNSSPSGFCGVQKSSSSGYLVIRYHPEHGWKVG